MYDRGISTMAYRGIKNLAQKYVSSAGNFTVAITLGSNMIARE